MTHSDSMQIEHFFDPATWTLSYLVIDNETRRCAVIDSVLDYDPKSGRTSTRSVDALIARAKAMGVTVDWILETHVHTDHLSAAQHVKRELGGQIAIGDRVTAVQDVFVSLFNVGTSVARDGSQFDRLLHDNEVIKIGNLDLCAWHTPGHTPACMSYVVEADTATTAIINLVTTVYSATGTLTGTEQDRYRITSTGALTPVTTDIQYAGASLMHLVLTY